MTFAAVRSGTALALAGLLSTGLLTACAPGTPDEDSWRRDAMRTVGDVSSAVQTARLGLALARLDRLPQAYLQTVLVEAEDTSGSSTQKLSAVQPPQLEQPRATALDDRLQQASGLIRQARIAVVNGDSDRYAALGRRLARTADDLDGIEGGLEHPPDAASR